MQNTDYGADVFGSLTACGERITTDREAGGETGRRSQTAPNCRQIAATAARRYVREVLRLAASMSVRAIADYLHSLLRGVAGIWSA
jgi:hypothetical protein